MKITKERYEKALKSLAKLRQAEQIVKEWDAAEAANPDVFENSDVVQIERSNGEEFRLTVQKRLVEA